MLSSFLMIFYTRRPVFPKVFHLVRKVGKHLTGYLKGLIINQLD